MEALKQPVRGVLRTRAAAPHLPSAVDGELLVVDASLASGRPLDALVSLLQAAGLRPAAVFIATLEDSSAMEPAGVELPILATVRPPLSLADSLATYLRDEPSELARLATELRLAAAEAALADPEPASAAGMVAARIGRGVAVASDGVLRSLHPRPAGRALAARFAATYTRLLSGGATRAESTRRTRDGLWLLERRIRSGASLWLFDDIPFARIDEVAADALAITLRALLRRPLGARNSGRGPSGRSSARPGPLTDRIQQTLLAVARANGRVAPAARALGVHRNTVLYRLRLAAADGGLDPRRPDDALRILAAEERR
ncbi:MAG TPA: helix-turn-helix domain-containing protein [Candidatus Saccharimonadales bacterium]|nr:helix-turn-helix domain-containing protein [Candidatus Saccharimonadales bacterium]